MKGPVYLHVGGDVMVKARDVVAILDEGSLRASAANREFLGFTRARGRVLDVGEGQARSVVVCADRVVLSPVSPGTLLARHGTFGSRDGP